MISHATIETEYVCLSYRWGDDDANTSKSILLDGKLFVVRQNLHDFLDLASSEHEWSEVTQRRYWIDALCINQSDGAERNHQVAQMGNIFASARNVHVWLGKTSDPCRMSKQLAEPSSNLITRNEPTERRRGLELIGRYILHNEYWDRAWVVQEIVLAQYLMISLDATTLPISGFFRRINQLHVDIAETPFRQFAAPDQKVPLRSLRDTSLLSLLGWFRDKHCSVPRDRVFSLLAVCCPEERIEVNYANVWTDLVVQVLSTTRHSPCICSAALLTRSLMPPDWLHSSGTVHIPEPMFTFHVTDLYDDTVYKDTYKYAEGNLLWSWGASYDLEEQRPCMMTSHALLGRACLRGLLRIVKTAMKTRVPSTSLESSGTTNVEFGYGLESILRNLSESLILKHKETSRSLIKLIHIFWASKFREPHLHLFGRMEKGLLWFNFTPGWYISAREDQPDMVTLRVSFSALAKASSDINSMGLCGWEGERAPLTKEDSLFRRFSVYHPTDN
jgi:hypothetical protein